MAETKPETKFVMWHQVDQDGEIEAVFASPADDLYECMMHHAENVVVETAEEDVKTGIKEDEEAGVIEVSFKKDDTEEMVTLLPGLAEDSEKEFKEVMIYASTIGIDYQPVSVSEKWGDWESVPEEFYLNEDELEELRKATKGDED